MMTIDQIREQNNIAYTLTKTSRFSEARSLLVPLLLENELLQDPKLLAEIHYNIGVCHYYLQNYAEALNEYQFAIDIQRKDNDFEVLAKSLTNIGLVHFRLGNYSMSIDQMNQALECIDKTENEIEKARILGNIGIVYSDLLDYSKAIHYYELALRIYEKHQMQNGIASNLGSIGIVFNAIGDFEKSLEYFSKALHIFEVLDNKFGIAGCLGNIGAIHYQRSEFDSAFIFFQKAIETNTQIGNKSNIIDNYHNLGNVYLLQNNYESALECFTKAVDICEEIGDQRGVCKNNIAIASVKKYFDETSALELLHQCIAFANESESLSLQQQCFFEFQNIYQQGKDFKNALYYYKEYIALNDSLLSEETKNKALLFDQRRKIEEDEKARQLKLARFQEQEKLLHNVLPSSIADRILKQETFIADGYQSVSVLFMDLVGFTALSSIAPPKQLVYLLDTIFTKADEIIERYGLEKIKTIGDGYMAVANVTTPLENHQLATAKAALALLQGMKELVVSFPEELGDSSWTNNMNELQIRIGIHSGEVVAGIIGKNKYTFDLWGDAVNIASRMESSSDAGRIHISEVFAKSIETHPEFKPIPRGEISIKGKGTMNTFWLENGTI